jgi:hypothetical protein
VLCAGEHGLTRSPADWGLTLLTSRQGHIT